MTSKQETDDAIYTIKHELFKLRRLVMALWGEVREVEPSNYKALHQEVLHLVGEVPIGDRFSGSLHALEDIKEVQSFRLKELTCSTCGKYQTACRCHYDPTVPTCHKCHKVHSKCKCPMEEEG